MKYENHRRTHNSDRYGVPSLFLLKLALVSCFPIPFPPREYKKTSSLVQSSTIEPKHLAFFYNWCLFKAYCTVKTSGSIVRLSAHDEVCNGWTSIDNYTDFFLCVLRALCGELCISTFQLGSYLAWQLGQMRMILQVSFVNRANEVWKPSSYPHWGQTWSSFFIEMGFGLFLSNFSLHGFFYHKVAKFFLGVLELSWLSCWFNLADWTFYFYP